MDHSQVLRMGPDRRPESLDGRFNRAPCDRLIEFLKEYFDPFDPGPAECGSSGETRSGRLG